ncbi:MAG TPA: ribosome maturation factor RimP [Gammaproteobacteria bacterium]|nr:ribosome maturation factor RimP [Gammaproteobacteria bacterium]
MRMRERLLGLLEPAVVALGYELVELEFHGQGRNSVLRLYIDGPKGVTLDDCERVSRQVSGVLDVEDPIPGHYALEVSSPGLDRPLRRLEDFERFVGQRAKLELLLPLDGRRRFTGTLAGVEAGEVLMDVEGERLRLPFTQMGKAHLVPEF